MVDDFQHAYAKFLAEIQKINDAAEAKFERLDTGSNVVLISGEVIGTDTRERIVEIGEKHGLVVLAQQLSVLYRQ